MPVLKQFIRITNAVNDWVGRIASTMIYLLILFLVWEVVMRYVFNLPTIWAHELSSMIYAVFFLLGGPYALRWGAHINVEIIYIRFSPRTRALLDLFTWIFFYIFIGFMLVDGITTAAHSISVREVSHTVWAPPIWPVKLFIPVSALLMLVQGAAKTSCDLYTVITGQQMDTDAGKEPLS